ncbi:hypothetical protein [Pontibacter rugosus]
MQQLHAQELTTEFDFDNSYPYTQMLIDQINKKNDSWAIRWYASAFLENKYTLYPTKTLVKNIGLDMSGTHSGIDATLNDSSLSAESFTDIDKIEIQEHKEAKELIINFFRNKYKKGIKQRIINFFSK